MIDLRTEQEIMKNWKGDLSRPLVSISCLAYNHEKYIEGTLKGFLIQKTDFPFEILIHDDASPDRTADIIREYEARYPKLIKSIYQTENQFSKKNGAIRRIQITRAKGKYFALCEGDDYWTDPLKLQKQVDFMEANQEFSGCFHETQQIFEDGRLGKIYGRDANEILTTEDTISTLSPFHTSSFIFKNVVKEWPEWINKITSVDMAYFSIISSFGPLKKLSEVMSVYRKHDEGMANTDTVINNLHRHRIELMNYLNEFHNYKYDSKVKQVIDIHKKLFDEQNRTPTNHQDNKSISNSLTKFLKPELSIENMDLYLVRKSILNALTANIPEFHGTLLDLGCGEMPYRQYIFSNSEVKKYIGLDIENPTYQQNIKPDLFWDGSKIPLDDNSIDTVMATELFEHLPDIELVLNEINRVLKPGGLLFFTVPFLWPLHDAPRDEYRYTPFALERHLKSANFTAISIKALGGWNASLAQMIGLWLKRSGLTRKQKELFTKDLFTFYNHLLQNDVIPQTFHDQTMPTGFSGTAFKNGDYKFQEKDRLGSFAGENAECPICGGTFPKFLPFGVNARENALCPKCGSLERHRLLWLYLKERTNLFTEELSLLDVAPMKILSEKFRSLRNINYLSIDLESPMAMRHMDITALDLPDNSFDCVLCYHVLEYIPNDIKAISEIFRVLKPGGWAILQVPLNKELKKTIEGAHIKDPQERKRLFGLEDHIRAYGLDYQERLMGEGFNLNIDDYAQKFSDEDAGRFSIIKSETIFFCTKPYIDNKTQAMLENNLISAVIENNDSSEPGSTILSPQVITVAGSASRNAVLPNDKTDKRRISFMPKNNKIIIIEAGFPTVTETFILDQITGLIDRGLEIENWAIYNTGTNIIHQDIIKYNLINKTKYIAIPPKIVRKDPYKWLQDFIEKNNIRDLNDVPAFHVHFGENFNLFEPLFRTIDKFVLVSFHGYDASKYFLQKGDDCYNYLFKRADRITTPSHFMKNELVKRGCDPNKIIIHRYGIDLKRFVCKRRVFNKGKITFLTVGRFVEKKGIEYSLKAFAKIHKSINAEYRIIGEGKLLDEYLKIVGQEGITDNVNFLGSKTKAEVIEEMRNADIFVLTSITAKDGDSEGVPVSLTEAHAMGLPVVSSYHAGIPELVIHEKTGLLSNEKDIEIIAQNMLKTASNISLRKRLSKNAVERVKDEFDIARLNNRLFSILSESLSPARNVESSNILVSVIMAAHNAAHHLSEAIQSVLKQTHQDFELIIVDDASTDETGKILEQFNDPRIKIIKNSENLGPAGSRNKALAVAAGKYIAIMDSDDISLPHRFTTEIEYLERNPDVAMVGSSFYEIDEKNQVKRLIKVLTESSVIKDELLKQNWLGHSTVIIRRDIMSEFGGYDEAYRYSHDYDLFLKISEKYKISNIEEPLCCWRSTAQAISASKASEQRYYADLAVTAAIERRKQFNSTTEFPLVSVIVPTYNRPEMLKDAINSILAQRYQNYEIIVVNDSGQDVETVISELNKDINKITYIKHSRNKGLAASRNTGIMLSRGKYIALLDDDDIFYPDHLETAVRELSESQKVVYTDAVRVTYRKKEDGYELVDKKIPYSIDYDRNKLLLGNISPVNCFVFDRNLALKAGLIDETLSTLEDWDFWIRLSSLAPLKHIRKPTVQVNWRTDGTTMTTSRRSEFKKNREAIYAKNRAEINRIPNAKEIMAEFQAIWSQDAGESLQYVPVKMRTNKGLVSIIILTFNQLEYTRLCLGSIGKYTSMPYELIIVDNGSTDGTRDYLENFSRNNNHVALIQNEENRGFAEGNNQGLARAKGDYIVLLNNDVVVTKHWLERLISHMENHPDIGMVGPMSNAVSGPQLVEKVPYGTDMKAMQRFAGNLAEDNAGKTTEVMRLVGFCLLIKKDVINIIGGLDENYISGNFEDDDLCLRSLIAGYRNIIAHDVFVHHFGSMTFKGNAIDYGTTIQSNSRHFAGKWRDIVELTSGGYRVNLTKEMQLKNLITWGEERFSRGDLSAAIKIFKRALRLDGSNSQALNNIGVIQWQLGDAVAAIGTFQSALTLNPVDTDALGNLAGAITETSRFDLLNPDLLAFLKQTQPTNTEIHSLIEAEQNADRIGQR